MMFIGLAASAYTSLVSSNRKANNTQKLYSEVRFVFDSLANEIRSGPLDYSCVDPEFKTLCILRDNGRTRSIFTFNSEDKKIYLQHQTALGELYAWSPGEIQPLTSDAFPLEDFSFSIFPLQNPYQSGNESFDNIQFQPSVTVSLRAGNYNFRTVYSSRNYGNKTLYAS